MEISAKILNTALKAFITTVPYPDDLQKHIEKKGLISEGKKIKDELDSLLRTANDILYDYPGGVPWTEEFEKEYRESIEQKHPWIDDAGFKRIMSYSGWICWHDGLNA